MNYQPRKQDSELDQTGPQRVVSKAEPATNEASPGRGWWQGADLKWYPPEQHHNSSAPISPARQGASTSTPNPWEQARPHIARGRRVWSGLSRERKMALAGAGAVVVAVTIAAPVMAFHYFFGGPSLPPEAQFARDVASAGIISADPAVKASIKLPAGPESTGRITELATVLCAALNNGDNKDAVAMQLYQGALEGTLTGGASLSHDNAVTIVDLAVQDVCPGK
jgi:hypothetical protein